MSRIALSMYITSYSTIESFWPEETLKISQKVFLHRHVHFKRQVIQKISQLKAYKSSILDLMLFLVISQCLTPLASSDQISTYSSVLSRLSTALMKSRCHAEVVSQGYKWASMLGRRPNSTTPWRQLDNTGPWTLFFPLHINEQFLFLIP